MEILARQIRRELELKTQTMGHCAIYENELQRLWPLNAKDREAKIAQFAKEYGFRLRHYKKGLCAIFDKRPRETRPGCAGKINAATAAAFVLGSFFLMVILLQPAMPEPKVTSMKAISSNNEHEYLLCDRNKEFQPGRIDP